MMTRKAALEAGAVALGGALVAGVVLGEHADPAISAALGQAGRGDPQLRAAARVRAGRVPRRGAAAGEADRGARGRSPGPPPRTSRTHIALLKQALGSAARKPPTLDFGDDTADEERYSLAAFKLEDLGVAAYTAQAPNLTKGALSAAARIVSVESRHAAWIRDLRGMNPAPDAAEPAVDAQRVIDTFKGSGYVK